MREAQRLGVPAVRRNGKALRLGLGERGVRRDERDRRRGRRAAFPVETPHRRRDALGQAEAAEFVVLLEGAAQKCGPSPMIAEAMAFTMTSAPTV